MSEEKGKQRLRGFVLFVFVAVGLGLVALGMGIGAASLEGRTQDPPDGGTIVEVACPDPEGCFLALSRALERAPHNATLSVGPGLYYEKPMRITQSLTIRGAGPGKTRIQIVDSGAAFTVEGPDPLAFTLQDLYLKTRIVERDVAEGPNRGLVWRQGPEAGEQALRLENVHVESDEGVAISAWNGEVAVIRSRIYGVSQGISATGGGDLRVRVEESAIQGPLGSSDLSVLSSLSFFGVSLLGKPGGGQIEARIEGSQIHGWGRFGVVVGSLSFLGWSRVRAVLEGNRVGFNFGDAGVYLKGDVEATLVGNRIEFNEGYGVMLLLPPCPPATSAPEEHYFRGIVSGRDNEFVGNKKGALCPEAPWPEDFVASDL